MPVSEWINQRLESQVKSNQRIVFASSHVFIFILSMVSALLFILKVPNTFNANQIFQRIYIFQTQSLMWSQGFYWASVVYIQQLPASGLFVLGLIFQPELGSLRS